MNNIEIFLLIRSTVVTRNDQGFDYVFLYIKTVGFIINLASVLNLIVGTIFELSSNVG